MAIQADGFYYNKQLKNYILQFMAIFQGLQVQVGKSSTEEERLISVPIHYGAQDRVVAAIIAENTQNKLLRMPAMSAYLRNMELAHDRMHGSGLERRNTYTPTGGLVPNDMRVIHQMMPVPYDLEMELTLFASNADQHFQMLEQILPLFNPQLTIQTSDATFDWVGRLTSVELTRMTFDNNYPIGTERRINQSTLTFKMPVFIDTPADVRRDFVERVFVRVAAVNSDLNNSYDVIAEIDGQGIPYDLVQDASDVKNA